MHCPLTGHLPPKMVASVPNTMNVDYITGMIVDEEVSIVSTSQGQILIYSMPDWTQLDSKIFPKSNSISRLTNEKLVILNDIAPIITDLGLNIVTKYKKPVRSLHPIILTSLATKDSIITAASRSGTIITWDTRAEKPPHILTLTGKPSISSITSDGDTVTLSTQQGKIIILDSRNSNKRVSEFDLSHILNIKSNLDVIARRDNIPWSINFQFANGVSGVFDIMSGIPENVITPPHQIERPKYAILKPIFYQKYSIFGFSWSPKISLYKKGLVTEIDIVEPPMCIASSSYWDGIFAATILGDIMHVL